MSDGPTDFGSGYLFESQKGISDRRSARGLSSYDNFAQGQSFSAASSSGGRGGSVAGTLVGVFVQIMGFLLIHVAPILLKLATEVLKGIFSILGTLISRRR